MFRTDYPDWMYEWLGLDSAFESVIGDELDIAAHFMYLYLGIQEFVPTVPSSGYLYRPWLRGNAQFMNLCKLMDEEPRIKDDLRQNVINCVVNGDPASCGPFHTTSGIGGLSASSSSLSEGTHTIDYADPDWVFRLAFSSNLNVRYALGTFSIGAHTETATVTKRGNDIIYQMELEAWDNYDWANNDDPSLEGEHPLGMLASDFRAAQDTGSVAPYTVYGAIDYRVTARNAGACPSSGLPVSYEVEIGCVSPRGLNTPLSRDWITFPLWQMQWRPRNTSANTDNILFYP